uniref:Uncharacterized protein n=1 Tax=Meloidogyne enterolobii TaxID=390850 RepID=A0A6V7TN25_MELEN|nr:unnamed protein product [Meloidogyne enterolobii]
MGEEEKIELEGKIDNIYFDQIEWSDNAFRNSIKCLINLENSSQTQSYDNFVLNFGTEIKIFINLLTNKERRYEFDVSVDSENDNRLLLEVGFDGLKNDQDIVPKSHFLSQMLKKLSQDILGRLDSVFREI